MNPSFEYQEPLKTGVCCWMNRDDVVEQHEKSFEHTEACECCRQEFHRVDHFE